MVKINFVDEIPQWITSSNIAAYHPAEKTIWIRNDLGIKTVSVLLHEFLHYFIDIFFNKTLHSNCKKATFSSTIFATIYPKGVSIK